jgi:putative peptidoglycan lipid II flippase
MTPRQVRAGVSPALDNVCDQVLGDPPRHRAPALTTATALVNALTKVLGTADASADLERRLHQPIPLVRSTVGTTDPATGSPPVSALLDQATEEMTAIRPPVRPAASAPASRPAAVHPLRTAGPATVTTAVGSRPAPPPVAPVARPRQHRRWVAVLAALCALLVGAGVVSARILDQRLAADRPAPSAPASSTAPPAPVGPLKIRSVRDFDPQGDTREEHRDEVGNAVDGNPETRWSTVSYRGNPKLGGIKRGVGLVLDLGTPQDVRAVKLSLSGDDTDVQLRVPEGDPAATSSAPMTSDGRWRTVATRSGAGSAATLTPAAPVSTRFVLVYLTSLPKEGKGYRGGIYEAEVLP